MDNSKLNLVNEIPSKEYFSIICSEIKAKEIKEKELIFKYVDIFIRYNIHYISYIESEVVGEKFLSTIYKLYVFIKRSDEEFVSKILIDNDIVPPHILANVPYEIEDIEEFKGVDIYEDMDEIKEMRKRNEVREVTSIELFF